MGYLTWIRSPEMIAINRFAVQSTEKLSLSQPAEVAPTKVWGGAGT